MTMLPAGGSILYVDVADDRGGPAQAYFDHSFALLGVSDDVDRFDVLGPSSIVNNRLHGRVTDYNQIVDVYQTIIWHSGDLSNGTIGDETTGSADFDVLDAFLRLSNQNVGLYLTGDNLADEWSGLNGVDQATVRSDWMSHEVPANDHVNYGESLTPTLTATGADFIHEGTPDQLLAYGGCAPVKAFDVLRPTGAAITEFPYPNSGEGAVISQTTTNEMGFAATVVLSGFSYTSIADVGQGFPIARVEHLGDILTKFGHSVSSPSGVDPVDGPQYANALYSAYPNPFNPTTTIKYGIKARTHVSLKVYNAAGQLVATLVDDMQSPDGIRPVKWYGTNNAGQQVSSGVYFYKLITKDFSKTRKMVLLK